MKWFMSLCLFLIGVSGLHAQEVFALPIVVTSMAIHPSSEYVALSIGMDVCHETVDHKITLLSYPDLQPLSFIDFDADCPATGLEWSHDGRYLLITTYGNAYVWDNEQQTLISTSPPYSMGQRYEDRLSPDGMLIANTSQLTGIILWSPQTGEIVQQLFASELIFTVSWSPDGQFFVISMIGEDHLCHIVETQTFTSVAQFPCYASIPSWSPNGKYILNANRSSFYVWETQDYTLMSQWDNPVEFEDFEWMPDGQHIAVALSNQKLALWDVETGIKTSEVDLDQAASRISISPADGSLIYVLLDQDSEDPLSNLHVITASSFPFMMPTPTPAK